MIDPQELLDKLAAIEAGEIMETHICRHLLRSACEVLTDQKDEIDRLTEQRARLNGAYWGALTSFAIGWPGVVP
jgi:hypothetical protein